MISQDHKKHSDIARPSLGNFGRNEFAIVGTQCNSIRLLATEIIKTLSADYRCVYADAEHAKDDEQKMLPGRLAHGAFLEYTDKINHHEFNYHQAFNTFRFRQMMHEADLILVNGNHHAAKMQVVVLDANKIASLKKRASQLTNVVLFLLDDNTNDVFDFVKEALPYWQQVPVYHFNETGKIIQFFESWMRQSVPKLHGLVLAGGKSMRMGTDKGSFIWHGKEQRYYMADLLKELCREVFISCRTDQQQEIDRNYQTLADTFTGLGPFGAILSAFREQPDAAWLVVACDLPLLDRETLQYLIAHRNIATMATAFESPHDSLPEPLITIWEPKAYPVLLSFLSQGYSCPRKVLRNSDVTIIKPPHAEALMNVNTPEERESVQQVIQMKMITV